MTAEPLTANPCPGPHSPVSPIDGQPVWCLLCENRIRTALAGPMGIEDLLALATTREDGRLLERQPRQLVSGRTPPAPPTPSATWDEIDDVTRWAGRAATEIAAQLGRRGDYSTDLPDLAFALGYLLRNLRPALVGPWAVEFGQSVLRQHRRLQHVSGERPLLHVLKVTCPACDQRGLVREDGADRVDCRLCGATWSEDGFQDALQAQLPEDITEARACTAGLRARA